jgi:hypothetical protein
MEESFVLKKFANCNFKSCIFTSPRHYNFANCSFVDCRFVDNAGNVQLVETSFGPPVATSTATSTAPLQKFGNCTFNDSTFTSVQQNFANCSFVNCRFVDELGTGTVPVEHTVKPELPPTEPSLPAVSESIQVPQSAPETRIIRPRKLAFLGTTDTGKSTLFARLLRHSLPISDDAESHHSLVRLFLIFLYRLSSDSCYVCASRVLCWFATWCLPRHCCSNCTGATRISANRIRRFCHWSCAHLI